MTLSLHRDHTLSTARPISVATGFLFVAALLQCQTVAGQDRPHDGAAVPPQEDRLELIDSGYFEARGLNVLVFNNWYSGLFSDSKLSGIEIVHHGRRTATNGDVRLSNTPEQWDPIPELVDREVDQEAGRIQARLAYHDYGFEYRLTAEPSEGGLMVRVHLDRPLPKALEGLAGFNLEFLPSVYFGKTYLMDGRGGHFPRSAAGPMALARTGVYEAAPLATGSRLVLAPDDPERRVAIDGRGSVLSLYDGRNKAQNGWFVVRTLLPADRTGVVVEWLVTPNRVPLWVRRPVIAHSQLGYLPQHEKVAVIEMDEIFDGPWTATLFRIQEDGLPIEALTRNVEPWGRFLRYNYARFDFSTVSESGLYVIELAGVRSDPFRIDDEVFSTCWQLSLDTFLPVQMDHMFINDRYRVWHGASHLDDALQAPVDHVHFDLYAQGPTTDTPFRPGEHIPGLSVGGWYDAGDFDLRTQSQYGTVNTLVMAHELFGIEWDETTVRQAERLVDLRRPDGVPDILQQIEHGTLALLAQFRAIGHAIPGIVEPDIGQYTHLGDGVTKTDNLIYNPTLEGMAADGVFSGAFDDRWAFTSRTTPLQYGAAAALAAASRVLRGYNDSVADEALEIALRVWDEEQGREPVIFNHGNTTGGPLQLEELRATVELLITSNGGAKYAAHLNELLPYIEQSFAFSGVLAVRALPYMDETYAARVRDAVRRAKEQMDGALQQNPYGVPVTRGGWGGAGAVLGFGVRAFIFHKAFPDIVGPEYTLRAANYILGTHPDNNVSLVSGVGARSKTIAYGMNRADYSFIPGGVVPGLVIIEPDLPELQEDWPFLWYENEYVIPTAAMWILLGNAANELARK